MNPLFLFPLLQILIDVGSSFVQFIACLAEFVSGSGCLYFWVDQIQVFAYKWDGGVDEVIQLKVMIKLLHKQLIQLGHWSEFLSFDLADILNVNRTVLQNLQPQGKYLGWTDLAESVYVLELTKMGFGCREQQAVGLLHIDN